MSPETKGAYIELMSRELTRGEKSAKTVISLLKTCGIEGKYLPGENPTEASYVTCEEDLTPDAKSQLLKMKEDIIYIWDDEGTKDFVESIAIFSSSEKKNVPGRILKFGPRKETT